MKKNSAHLKNSPESGPMHLSSFSFFPVPPGMLATNHSRPRLASLPRVSLVFLAYRLFSYTMPSASLKLVGGREIVGGLVIHF